MSLKQPVRYPVKYYSHLDADAPQLADADGVIKTILKACLVTGYGDKASAGWTSLFEDVFRIVLRRPLGTGNPPDIKIENGVINGAASHRIVSQDNPTGLDDATELAAVNLLARDSKHGNEWHLIVSDFGFLLCYQMGEYGREGDRNNILVCSSLQKIRDLDNDVFTATESAQVSIGGKGGASGWLSGVLYTVSNVNANSFKNMRNGTLTVDKKYLTLIGSELSINNEHIAQQIIIDSSLIAPFFCSAFLDYPDMVTKVISIDDRPMLRYVNKVYQPLGPRVLYIPIDYWEL